MIFCSGLSRNFLTIFLIMYLKNLKTENVLIYFMNTVQNKRKSYTLFVKVIFFVNSKNGENQMIFGLRSLLDQTHEVPNLNTQRFGSGTCDILEIPPNSQFLKTFLYTLQLYKISVRLSQFPYLLIIFLSIQRLTLGSQVRSLYPQIFLLLKSFTQFVVEFTTVFFLRFKSFGNPMLDEFSLLNLGPFFFLRTL